MAQKKMENDRLAQEMARYNLKRIVLVILTLMSSFISVWYFLLLNFLNVGLSKKC